MAAAGTRSVLLSRIKGATDKPPACPSTRRTRRCIIVLVERARTDGRVGLLGLLRRGLGAGRGCLLETREEWTRTCSASAVKGEQRAEGQSSCAGLTGRSGRRDSSSGAATTGVAAFIRVVNLFIRAVDVSLLLERTLALERTGSMQSERTGTSTAGRRRATCKCNCRQCRTTRFVERRGSMMHNHGELGLAARRRARVAPSGSWRFGDRAGRPLTRAKRSPAPAAAARKQQIEEVRSASDETSQVQTRNARRPSAAPV